jgi:hypothetical protein
MSQGKKLGNSYARGGVASDSRIPAAMLSAGAEHPKEAATRPPRCLPFAADAELAVDLGWFPTSTLDMLGMSEMWVGIRPRLTEWFERMKSRASFRP